MLNRIAALGKCRARQWRLRVGQNCGMRRAPRLSQRFTLLDRDRDLAAENFYTISTDAHIDNIVMPDASMSDGILASSSLAWRATKMLLGTVHFRDLARSEPARRSRPRHGQTIPGSADPAADPGLPDRLRYKNHAA